MVKKVSLQAETRQEKNGKASSIRENGYLPVILYGSELKENINLKVKDLDFKKAFELAGESTLIDLSIDGGESTKVIIKDIQNDPIKDSIIHADLYKVNMKEKIEVEIPLNFINEAPAVKELGGTLVKNMETVDAKCLPGDLVDHLDVDLSVLKTFDDSFKLKHLSVPGNIELLEDGESSIASVLETKEEVIEEPTPEEATEAVEGEEKREGEDESKVEGKPAEEGGNKKE